MILNTGARTDTVQYFSDWLFRRFKEGYVCARNPLFPNKVIRYELSPEKIDAVLFCSKNYAPALSRLHEITDKYRTYFHYTVTAYGKDVEPGVPSVDESIKTLAELSRTVGRQRVAIVAAFLVRERGGAYDRKEKPYSEELPEKPAEEKIETEEDEPETRSKIG